MTTAVLPLPYLAHEGVVLDERRLREQAIERVIGFAHDYDEPRFLEVLRGFRPDLSDDDIEAAVDDLTGLSFAAQDSRIYLNPDAARSAIDDYESALRRFAKAQP